MLNPAEFHALVRGETRGVRASVLRAGLRLAETPYTLAMRFRNWRYDRGSLKQTRVAAPVVSVGNLTLGGTGKTPFVEWLAKWLRARNVRVAIVSRGYGAGANARNDEAMELEERLPDVPHVQNPDRVAGANLAIEEFASQFIVLDDGFQHRRIARDLDIVLLDALEPFGYGHVFPRGALREPPSGLARAQVIVLSRADQVENARRHAIEAAALKLAPHAAWVEAIHAPLGFRSSDGTETPVETLRGARIAAFCGIGTPAAFRGSLADCGCEVVAFREFPDHHAYSREDIESLASWARGLDVASIVCTHKDLVKIGVSELGGKRLSALLIGLEITSGLPALEKRLKALVPAADSNAG